jgi:adenylate cyclase
MTKKVTRKLRAIMSADVKGYSLLMADDEVFTIRTLKEYRNIMSTLIDDHSGRIVDTIGDNLLVEFESAVNAVQCAVEVQKELKAKNQELTGDKKLEFRIGINIGDVIQDGDRIFGDGVNVAARIESLAEAGGICISRSTYDHVKNKLELSFDYLGAQQVKNIKDPVRVYKVLLDTESPKPLVEEQLELPDKPSIAVLPFVNMSGDPSQDYFSDGLTEQIINGLCKVSNLFVIARNSSFAYKGKSVGIKQIARELGVKYVLEGSVQKAGDSVRITAQLVDAVTDYHIWSENYDRDLSDIFALQDEITMELITAMQVKLTQGEQARTWTKGTNNLQAFMHILKGLEYLHRDNLEDTLLARRETEKAISLDPNFIMAYTLLAFTYVTALWWETGSLRINTLEKAEENIDKALELDNESSNANICLAMINLFKRKHDEAVYYGNNAVVLNRNNAFAYLLYGYILYCSGRLEEALKMVNSSFRLNPIPSSVSYVMRGEIYFSSKKYDKALMELLLNQTIYLPDWD